MSPVTRFTELSTVTATYHVNTLLSTVQLAASVSCASCTVVGLRRQGGGLKYLELVQSLSQEFDTRFEG